jgi:hypothetical protein
MRYNIYNIKYSLDGLGQANSVISANSPERAQSLLENYLREEDNIPLHLRGAKIKIESIVKTRVRADLEGVIFNSEAEEPSDCVEEGLKSGPFSRD